MSHTTQIKILYLITKSNFGENENRFSFSPILREMKEQSLANSVRQTVGEPTKFYSV